MTKLSDYESKIDVARARQLNWAIGRGPKDQEEKDIRTFGHTPYEFNPLAEILLTATAALEQYMNPTKLFINHRPKSEWDTYAKNHPKVFEKTVLITSEHDPTLHDDVYENLIKNIRLANVSAGPNNRATQVFSMNEKINNPSAMDRLQGLLGGDDSDEQDADVNDLNPNEVDEELESSQIPKEKKKSMMDKLKAGFHPSDFNENKID